MSMDWRDMQTVRINKVIYTKIEQVGMHNSCFHAWCCLLRAAKAAQ